MHRSDVICSVGARASSKISMKSGSLAFTNRPNTYFRSLSSKTSLNSLRDGATITLPPDPADDSADGGLGDGVVGGEEGRGEGVEWELVEAAGESG